jgi:catechol 2,3-dioxygenase-like lactoylglutathione lyase family enzyme
VEESELTGMKLEHIALQVPDPVAMADWYVKHLGMRVVRSGPPPAQARFIADSAGRTVLEVCRGKAL